MHNLGGMEAAFERVRRGFVALWIDEHQMHREGAWVVEGKGSNVKQNNQSQIYK